MRQTLAVMVFHHVWHILEVVFPQVLQQLGFLTTFPMLHLELTFKRDQFHLEPNSVMRLLLNKQVPLLPAHTYMSANMHLCHHLAFSGPVPKLLETIQSSRVLILLRLQMVTVLVYQVLLLQAPSTQVIFSSGLILGQQHRPLPSFL